MYFSKAKFGGRFILIGILTLTWLVPPISSRATQVFSWGRNYYGQLDVPSNLTNAIAIGAGYQHCLALRSDGTVVGWGQNTNGQTTIPASVSNNVVAIRSGYSHNLAQLNDGTLIGWGAGVSNT